AAAAPRGEPDPEAVRGDPGAVHRLRHPPMERREAAQASARETAQGARAQGEALPAVALHARRCGGRALARPDRGRWFGRSRRQEARLAVSTRVARAVAKVKKYKTA